MWTDLKNVSLTFVYIYAAAYSIGFIVALIKNKQLLKQEVSKVSQNTSKGQKFLVLIFTTMICLCFAK
jgi:TRAP-type uncharacterized transport system fused permease subunit